jgi:hypothetical protein
MVAALDLLDILTATVDTADPIATNVSVDLPYPPFVHVMPPTRQGRERIVSDYAIQCRKLLDLALEHAPHDATATLQTYVSALIGKHLLSQPHPGLDIALDLLSKQGFDGASRHSTLNGTSLRQSSTDPLEQRKARNNSSLMATFGPSLAMRNRYSGQLEGMLLAAAISAGVSTGTATAIASAETEVQSSNMPGPDGIPTVVSNVGRPRPSQGAHDDPASAAAAAGGSMPPERQGRASDSLKYSPFGQLPPPAPEAMITPRAKRMLASSVMGTSIDESSDRESTSQRSYGRKTEIRPSIGDVLDNEEDAAIAEEVAESLEATASDARPLRVAQPDQVEGLVAWTEDVLFRLRCLTQALAKLEQHRTARHDNGEQLGSDFDIMVKLPAEVTPVMMAKARGSHMKRPSGALSARPFSNVVSGHFGVRDARGPLHDVPLATAVVLFDEAMYQAAAILAFRPPGWDPLSHTTSALYADLMNALVWAPVRVFKATAMQTALACWSWLVSARPDSETRMMHDMQQAWFWCISEHRGLFSTQHGAPQGVEAIFASKQDEGAARLSRAMRLWLEYLSQRLTVVEQRSLSQAQLISTMVNHALLNASSWCQHPSMWATKYKLCCLALQLLHTQGVLTNVHHELVLRARLFDALLQDFAQAPRSPHTGELQEALDALFALHAAFLRDRPICKPLDQSLQNSVSVSPFNPGRGATAVVNGGRRGTQTSLDGQPAVVTVHIGSEAAPLAQALRRLGHDRFTRKCDLILLLLRDELDRLLAWYNPSLQLDRTYPGETAVRMKKMPSERTWREYVNLAWRTCPPLAVQLAHRFSSDAVEREVQRLVKTRPGAVSHIAEALPFLLTKANVEIKAPELGHVLAWAPVAPATALHLLRQFPGHPTVSQYCLRVLKSFSPEIILFYTPQLVQALRHDPKGYIAHYLVEASKHSQLLAHQIIWNMKTNQYMDEEGEQKDPVLFTPLERLLERIVGSFSGRALTFYQREFSFFDAITGVSGSIRNKPLGPERKAACLEELRKIELRPGCYLPSSPEGMVVEIDYTSGHPMQSAAKAPYLATFKVLPYGLHEMEEIGESVDENDNSDEKPSGDDPRVRVGAKKGECKRV